MIIGYVAQTLKMYHLNKTKQIYSNLNKFPFICNIIALPINGIIDLSSAIESFFIEEISIKIAKI